MKIIIIIIIIIIDNNDITAHSTPTMQPCLCWFQICDHFSLLTQWVCLYVDNIGLT